MHSACPTKSDMRGAAGGVCPPDIVKALLSFPSTDNIKVVNEREEAGWLAREGLIVSGCISVALQSCVHMVGFYTC